MATIKPILDTRAARQDKTYPIKISLAHRGKTVFIGIDESVKENQFKLGEVVESKEASRINKIIKGKIIKAQSALINLSISGELNKLDVYELKNKLFGSDSEQIQNEVTLSAHFTKYIGQTINSRTKQIYRETLLKINAYKPKITLPEVNITFLKEFDLFLSNSCAVNTRAIHMRNVRAVLNDAIDEELISLANYPFRKFKIKKEETRKRSLTVDQLKILRDYPCQDHQVKYRDLFMLSFYLIGINAIDLLELKHSDYVNGRIEYKRAKTGKLYSIEVLPEAEFLIKKYAGEKHLLDVMDKYTDHRDFTHRWNKNLQEIGPVEWVKNSAKNVIYQKKNKKKVTPLFPEITTYWARHSWATIASRLDIPKETISASLGHKRNDVTDVYIDFDMKKVDEANKKVTKAIL